MKRSAQLSAGAKSLESNELLGGSGVLSQTGVLFFASCPNSAARLSYGIAGAASGGHSSALKPGRTTAGCEDESPDGISHPVRWQNTIAVTAWGGHPALIWHGEQDSCFTRCIRLSCLISLWVRSEEHTSELQSLRHL